MDTLAHLIGRACVLWWRDAAGEQAKTDGVLQYDRRQARPYRVGTIDFEAGEALRTHGATIFLTTPIALAVVRESEPGVALAVAGSAADARREANRLSSEHPDVCIVRARTPAPEKATPQTAVDAPPEDTGEAATPNDTLYLAWTRLRPSGLNGLVRGELAPGAPDIEELAASIRDHGVIQNLVVVELDPPEDGADYEVLVGERRWLACRRLGDAAPPLPCSVVPRPASDLEALLLMGAENMQRKNLSPLEEARYFQALIDRLPDREKLKPAAALARRLRKRRRYVEDRLALLDLEAEVKEEVGRGTIAPGAARYLACLAGDDRSRSPCRRAGSRRRGSSSWSRPNSAPAATSSTPARRPSPSSRWRSRRASSCRSSTWPSGRPAAPAWPPASPLLLGQPASPGTACRARSPPRARPAR
jgi:ParB/RepB/Spo0J family partition protein